MPEGVKPYPRWDGPLASGPPLFAIVSSEFRRALRNIWFILGFALVLMYTVLFIGDAFSEGVSNEEASRDAYVTFITRPSVNFLGAINIELSFAPVLIAAIIGCPTLLEDSRRGALELYFARSLRPAEYLFAKVLAVLGVTTLALFLPGFIYWIFSFMVHEKFPAGWALLPLQTLAYALVWGLVVSGLALGFSAVSKSSRAATLLVFGGILVLHAVASNLLEAITENGQWQIISPLSAIQKFSEVIFGTHVPFDFPVWWAVLELAGLAVVGWLLLAWKHPRVRGA